MSRRKKRSKRPVPVKEDPGAFGFWSAFQGAWVCGAIGLVVYALIGFVLIELVDSGVRAELFLRFGFVWITLCSAFGAFTRMGRRWGHKLGEYVPFPL